MMEKRRNRLALKFSLFRKSRVSTSHFKILFV